MERGWCGIAMSQATGSLPAPGLQERTVLLVGSEEHHSTYANIQALTDMFMCHTCSLIRVHLYVSLRNT